MLELTYQADEQAVGHNVVGENVTIASTYDVRIAHAIAIIKARRCASNTDRELHWKKKVRRLQQGIL